MPLKRILSFVRHLSGAPVGFATHSFPGHVSRDVVVGRSCRPSSYAAWNTRAVAAPTAATEQGFVATVHGDWIAQVLRIQ
ncbi:hypothetical protein BRADO3338 [Bradyrhizobium sp. ORS 278]|nr:hypothetical protein BRADO3338 [Bradyrhizobium sp. ORS 278]